VPAPTQVDHEGLLGRISRLEWLVAAGVAVVLVGLTVAEPDILSAPFENMRTVVFTVGGTAVAAIVLVIMLRARVTPVVRVLVLLLPFAAVSWWLLSPFFLDDVVDDDFKTTIADATPQDPAAAPAAPGQGASGTPTTTRMPPEGPVLRGAGQFVGLAGHDGTGDAGFFVLGDGTHVLRFENFDIQNGPDLRLYVVPGADQTDPGSEALYLGELRGNVGDQTYDLPEDFDLTSGPWTVLVWCEAFSVEFVAATVEVA
jgi:hypothetical protein